MANTRSQSRNRTTSHISHTSHIANIANIAHASHLLHLLHGQRLLHPLNQQQVLHTAAASLSLSMTALRHEPCTLLSATVARFTSLIYNPPMLQGVVDGRR